MRSLRDANARAARSRRDPPQTSKWRRSRASLLPPKHDGLPPRHSGLHPPHDTFFAFDKLVVHEQLNIATNIMLNIVRNAESLAIGVAGPEQPQPYPASHNRNAGPDWSGKVLFRNRVAAESRSAKTFWEPRLKPS